MIIVLCLLWSAGYGATYQINDGIVGQITHYKIKQGDTLYNVARQHDIGIVEIMAANPGIDPWLPKKGSTLILPTLHVLPNVPHEGIVINLPELRLFYFLDDSTVMTFPIGIGKEGWRTPTGITKIVKKREKPVWIPPPSIREENPDLPTIVPAGPENPMGLYALNLSWPSFAIHGTNRPYGVGRRSSHGCIRLYPEDISALFHSVDIGTKVTIIDTPYKIGWYKNNLILEIVPNQEQADEIVEKKHTQSRLNIEELEAAINRFGRPRTHLSWYTIDKAINDHNGIPVVIGQQGAFDK